MELELHGGAAAALAGGHCDVASQVRDQVSAPQNPYLLPPASAPMSEDEVEQDDDEDEGEEGEDAGEAQETGSSGRPTRGVKRRKGARSTRRNAQVGWAGWLAWNGLAWSCEASGWLLAKPPDWEAAEAGLRGLARV